MIQKLLQDVTIFSLLHQIDKDLAEQHRKQGCSFCNAHLHYATYTRKPRGGPNEIPDGYNRRFSLCCSAPSCRRRSLPPSCLFMGRRVYWQCAILVAMALWQKKTDSWCINKIASKLNIYCRDTVKRWITYFKDVFPSTDQWQRLRGRISPEVKDNELPGGLFNYFLTQFSSPVKALVACLRFLASGQA